MLGGLARSGDFATAARSMKKCGRFLFLKEIFRA